MIAVPAALLLIFFLLYLTFNSLLQATLIFTAIPLASIGGVIALWIRDMPFSISAGVGFIALFGVAVLNGIVLISEFNSLMKSRKINTLRVVLRGTENRLRPVLLTAFVASLGFLPMALSHGSGAEVQKPLATVVIGGLVTATVLTLFILPVFYLLSQKIAIRKSLFISAVLILPNLAFSQANLTLEDFLDSAKENNSYLNYLKINSEKELLKGKTVLMPKTQASFMVGQFNSYYAFDNNLTLSQSIPYPTLFKEERKLGEIKSKSAQTDIEVAWFELKMKISHQIDKYYYTKAKIKILQKQDSLLSEIIEKIRVQKNVQDITKYEVSLAQTRKKIVENQLLKLHIDLENNKIQIQELTQLKNPEFNIKEVEYSMKSIVLNNHDTSWFNHPLINKYDQNKKIIQQESQVNKARQLPEFTFSYFNQSLVGVQNVNGVDTQFDPSNRFQGVQIGVDFSLFNKGYKNLQRTKDLEVQEQILQSSQQYNLLNSKIELLKNQYRECLISLELFESQILPETNLMQEEAKLVWQTGGMSLVDFFQLKEMVFKTENEYLDIKHKINQLVIEYNWLTLK
jgi:cobalt-zinc-cadmium resistance protein CzcA